MMWQSCIIDSQILTGLLLITRGLLNVLFSQGRGLMQSPRIAGGRKLECCYQILNLYFCLPDCQGFTASIGLMSVLQILMYLFVTSCCLQ